MMLSDNMMISDNMMLSDNTMLSDNNLSFFLFFFLKSLHMIFINLRQLCVQSSYSSSILFKIHT
jgi:hypothetical protein